MNLKLPAAASNAPSGTGMTALADTEAGSADFADGLAAAMKAAPSGGASSPLVSVLPPTQATAPPVARVSVGPGNFAEAFRALTSVYAESRNLPASTSAMTSKSGAPPPSMTSFAPEKMPEAVGILSALLAPIQHPAVSLGDGGPTGAPPQESVEHAATEPVVSFLTEVLEKIAAQPASPEPLLAAATGVGIHSSNEQEETLSTPADLLGFLFAMNLAPPSQSRSTSNLPGALAASIASSGLPVATAQASQTAPGVQGGSSSPLAALFADKASVAAVTGHSAEFVESLAAQIGIDPASSSASSVSRTTAEATLGAAAGIQATPADRATSPPPLLAPLDIRQPQAPQKLADSVVWHLDQGRQEVHIRLNPEELGPLEVKLRMDGDKVAVRFDMADASVRDVVQTSLTSLANLLSARGLMLDQAQVFSQGHGQPRPPSEFLGGDDAQSEDAAPVARPVSRRGLIDDYV